MWFTPLIFQVEAAQLRPQRFQVPDAHLLQNEIGFRGMLQPDQKANERFQRVIHQGRATVQVGRLKAMLLDQAVSQLGQYPAQVKRWRLVFNTISDGRAGDFLSLQERLQVFCFDHRRVSHRIPTQLRDQLHIMSVAFWLNIKLQTLVTPHPLHYSANTDLPAASELC